MAVQQEQLLLFLNVYIVDNVLWFVYGLFVLIKLPGAADVSIAFGMLKSVNFIILILFIVFIGYYIRKERATCTVKWISYCWINEEQEGCSGNGIWSTQIL